MNHLTDLQSGFSDLVTAIAVFAAIVVVAAVAYAAACRAIAQGAHPNPPDTHADLAAHDMHEALQAQTRRIRAGAPRVDGPDGTATLAPLPHSQQAAIARMARAIAVHDFHKTGHPRGNPYSTHSRAYALYAIEYHEQWTELADRERDAS